jgi:hypothetical protein
MQSLSLRLGVSSIAICAALALPLHAQSTIAEKLTDRCSVQVVIKNPYADNANIDPSDVLLDRKGNLGTVGSAMEAGHYVKGNSGGETGFSAVINPVPVTATAISAGIAAPPRNARAARAARKASRRVWARIACSKPCA